MPEPPSPIQNRPGKTTRAPSSLPQVYCGSDEAFVLSITEPLVEAKTLRSNLTNDLPPSRIVEVAHLINQPRLAFAARSLILENLWETKSEDIYELLSFGERVGDPEIIGVAYYQILKSSSPWMLDTRLSDKHRRDLQRGRAALVEEWQRIFDAWGTGSLGNSSYHEETHDAYWLHNVWRGLAAQSVPSFDIINKLSIAAPYALHRAPLVKANLNEVKAKIHTFFIEEPTST